MNLRMNCDTRGTGTRFPPDPLQTPYNSFNSKGDLMAQQIKTPPIVPCARCGAEAKCIDWDFRDMWKVMCDNNHTSTKECSTRHRAICRWNNAQIKLQDT